MFAAILRRWRLVTPLALAVLTISVVAGGVLMPASAHTAKFHFFARAYALADDSTVIPDTTCDTGYLAITGGTIETESDGHTGCGLPEIQGEPGAGITGSGRLEASLEDSKVVGTHSAHKGSVLSIVDIEEAVGAHARDLQGCPASIAPIAPAKSEENPSGACTYGFPAFPHPAFSLADDKFANQNAGDALFWGDLIRVFAEAECHTRLNGTTHASVKASIEMSDAAVREDNRLRYIGPQGSVGNAGDANTTFTISGFTAGQLIIRDIVVIINEQHQIEDGDVAGISANAIHLIGTGDDGLVKFNFILGHAFAGIHCARHLDGQDTLTIPGA
jgi:hypothetical protein